MEEEDVVLNTVIVFLRSVNWLVFVMDITVFLGRQRRRSGPSYDGYCMSYLEVCFPHPLQNAADV
jgi:hypothetical protein